MGALASAAVLIVVLRIDLIVAMGSLGRSDVPAPISDTSAADQTHQEPSVTPRSIRHGHPCLCSPQRSTAKAGLAAETDGPTRQRETRTENGMSDAATAARMAAYASACSCHREPNDTDPGSAASCPLTTAAGDDDDLTASSAGGDGSDIIAGSGPVDQRNRVSWTRGGELRNLALDEVSDRPALPRLSCDDADDEA